MAEGIVTEYSEDKGIGFIREETGTEIRVERSELEMPGYKYLNICFFSPPPSSSPIKGEENRL